MIELLKAILLEAIEKLEAVPMPAPMLPKEDMTVRQALERMRAEHDDMVCLQIEWQSYGSGRPFTVSFKAYSGASGSKGWTGEMTSLAATVESAGGRIVDAAQTADDLMASVTAQPELEPLPY